MITQILNTSLYNLKTWNSMRQSLGSKITGRVTNFNPDQYINVLCPDNIILNLLWYTWYSIYALFFIYSQCNCSHEFLLIFGVNPKNSIKFPKFSSWEPFIDQFHYMISLTNNKTNRRLKYPKSRYLRAYPSWILISNTS